MRTLASRRDICRVEPAPPSPEPVAAPARLWSLDVLRGVCAGVVFLSHWHLWSTFPPRGAAERAVHGALDGLHDALVIGTWGTGAHHPAVIAFFVLSGFCIHYPFERRALAGGATPDWRDYGVRRFRRIAPVFWAACGLGLLLVFVETVRPSGSPLLHLHASGDFVDLVVRVSGIGTLYPKEVFAGNYLLNTITVEIVMYAVYPVFFRLVQHRGWIALGAAFLALHVASVLLLPYITPFWVFNSVFMLGVLWYAGALAAHLFLCGRARVPLGAPLAAWALFLALKFVPHFYGLNLLKQAAWAAVCALGILWAIDWEKRHAAAGGHPLIAALRWSGDISYSLYAMHTPAIMLATWGLLAFGCASYAAQLAATMAASAVATLAVHYGIERRFYRLRSESSPAPASK